ncbi:MAG: O-methyltransferase, partial [uncultured Blastococcus sp.]
MSASQPPPASGTAEGAAYADRYAAETPEMTAARTRALQLHGSQPVEPATGAMLAVLAAGLEARSVVSIGSGGGLAGLWLLRGMRPDGVLTALDGDPEQLRAARKAFTDAGVAPGRARLIFGTPAEVLPRLSPAAYDMVVCAGPPR